MSRRRKKNPMLARIFLISVLLHVLFVPVLAYYGAFKKIGQSLGITQVVVLPPPPKEKSPEVKKTTKVAHTPSKSKSTSARNRSAAPKSNLNQPKVVAAKTPGEDDGSGPTVDANGAGKAGVVPTEKTTPNAGPGTDATPKPEEPAQKPEPKPDPKPTDPAPKPEVKPEPKKEPVFRDAEATSQPNPEIPDELRNEALSATVIAEFTVREDGTPAEVKISQSSGNQTLDRIALSAAKKWTFKPATRDGQPIESRVRLHIEFEVK